MPELPEVETSRRGISPHLLNGKISRVIVRQPKLRWPVPARLEKNARGQTIHSIERRGKYIILGLENGSILIHLGMSGSLRICDADTTPEKHDHIDIIVNAQKNKKARDKVLRLRDPRRFGCVLWTTKPVEKHKLLVDLGPEPLSDDFNGDYLYQNSRGRSASIKSFIMNSHIVVGVGNIYACESLFRAGINPKRKAGAISRNAYRKLATAIRETLSEAIEQGGTTLRDFTSENGRPGYFSQELRVYGRTGKNCMVCSKPIKQINQQGRSTFYCVQCQR